MDDFDKQLDRQQRCNVLADVINENYVGKVCEVQNVFLEKGCRIPFIGIVNKAEVVLRAKYNLPPNFYVAIEIKTAINTESLMYQEVYSVCIPPIPYYIQNTCNTVTDAVLRIDKTWKEMREMINFAIKEHNEYHKHDKEIGEEWQIKEYEQNKEERD